MLAINTDYKNDILSTEKMEEQIQNIAEAGYSHIHWCHDWEDSYMYSPSEMEQIQEWLTKYNLKVKSLHATEGDIKVVRWENEVYITQKVRNKEGNRKDYTSFNEYNRLAGVDLLKNRIDLAAKISAGEIVLHMQMPYEEIAENPEFEKKYWEQVFKSFDDLQEYCKSKKIRIAVENLLWTPIELQIEQFKKLFNRYDVDFLGFCYDSGHDAIMTHENHLDLLEMFKDRTIALHVNDNLGYSSKDMSDEKSILEHDKHLAPFEGMIDWDRFARLVAETPYEMPVLMELVKPGNIECDIEFLKAAKKAGNKLTNMILEYRKV